jgi:N-acetylglutamate synthase-like GNAT family acetyltransferase
MLSINTKVEVRNARTGELQQVGQLMVDVYSTLEGFPKPVEQPAYYQLLANVGELTTKRETEILVATSVENKIKGAVVYFGDMQYYGSGGTATQEKDAAGFRLLAVAQDARGSGIGKVLTIACIDKAKAQHRQQVIIHTTKAMQTAWKMYEKLGFKRSGDLDFLQGELPVFGFRLFL